MSRFPMSRWGLNLDPVGEYVALQIGERRYLGEVTSVYRSETRGMYHATVKHFNGEPWDFEPALSALEWIKQDA